MAQVFLQLVVVHSYCFLLFWYFSAEHVDSRIDAFLDEFGGILTSMTNQDFKSQVIVSSSEFERVLEAVYSYVRTEFEIV